MRRSLSAVIRKGGVYRRCGRTCLAFFGRESLGMPLTAWPNSSGDEFERQFVAKLFCGGARHDKPASTPTLTNARHLCVKLCEVVCEAMCASLFCAFRYLDGNTSNVFCKVCF